MAKPSSPLICPAQYQESRQGPKRFAVVAGLVLTLVLAAVPAAAEIETGPDRATPAPSPTRVGDNGTGAAGSLDGTVRARCWQHGNEILDVTDFASAAVPPELRAQAVSLRASGRTAVLLPFADTFCLLTISP